MSSAAVGRTAPTPRYLVADAKLYTENNAATLAKLGFITRIQSSLKLVSQVISQALQRDTWHEIDDTTCYQGLALCHYGMPQRWLVVSSHAAREHAEASVTKAQQREGGSRRKSNSFICKPTALRGPRQLTPLWRRWPERGAIIRSIPPV